MSETSQAPSSSNDPVRIVYHAGNRTFARLFNEHSLEEVKDVVRRKLNLGTETDVSLKQMGSSALLDLEDDGDFQAFRVLLKSSVSVDIQVTVGPSQDPAVPLPASPSRRPAGTVTSNQLSVHPEVVRTAEASTLPEKTPLARKRKVSFDQSSIITSDKPTEQRSSQPGAHPKAADTTDVSIPQARKPSARKRKLTPKVADINDSDQTTEQRTPAQPIVITPIASAKITESSTSKLGAEEPSKKKRKKESTKKTQVETTEMVESPIAKSAPKSKAKKSTTSDRSKKVDTSAPKGDETSEPPVKKQRKQKKDNSIGMKKSSASIDHDDMGQPIGQPGNQANEVTLQLEDPAGPSAEDGTLETSQSDKTMGPKRFACADIPQTSASTSVQSEVAAAILSGYQSKSETIPPEPLAKRQSAKRVTKKSSPSSSALLMTPTCVLDAPANEIRNPPDLSGPPCPICFGVPFHIRYCCPTVLKGSGAIRERFEELQRANTDDQQSLIKQLEGLLRDPKVMSEPSLDVASTNGVQLGKVLLPPNALLPRTSNIPSNSCLSEVTVESRDEGSSSESSDDMLEGTVEHQALSTPQRQRTPDESPLPSNNDLEAVIRGPVSKQQSILNILDRIVGDEDDGDSDSEDNEAGLDEDPGDETGRSRRWSSRCITHSSDSQSREEESRSPSPSCSIEDASNNLGLGVQNSHGSAKESAEHQDGDGVVRGSVNPSAPGAQDDEETHVEPMDRMVVNESIGEKGSPVIAEEQPSSPVPRTSVLQPLDLPSSEPQESTEAQANPVPNRDGTVSVAPKVPKGVEADPIEPADDFVPPSVPRSSNADPIEAPSEDFGSLFASATQSTPKPGVSKRIKTRDGRILDNDRPVLLEQLASEATGEVAKGKSRKMVTEMPARQEPAPTRKSPRFSSVPPFTSTPVAMVILNQRTRSGKATKTSAKRSEEQSDVLSSAKDDPTQKVAHITPGPSLNRWETLPEPSSPSIQLDEPLLLIDELMSSSPQSDDILVRGRSNGKEKEDPCRKPAASNLAESSHGNERLFDLSSSQIPFPYSQKQRNPAPVALLNEKEGEETTDSEEELKVAKQKAKMPPRYRPLSELASQASLFSPRLPTPANKSVTNGKAKKRAADEDSSSSSSSDEDEANGSEHIPRGRRAGSVLETRKKKSILSTI